MSAAKRIAVVPTRRDPFQHHDTPFTGFSDPGLTKFPFRLLADNLRSPMPCPRHRGGGLCVRSDSTDVALLPQAIQLTALLEVNMKHLCCAWMVAICLGSNGMTQQIVPMYNDVAPIFEERCIICHNGPGAPRKLQLTSYENIMKGSENGPVVLPGDARGSELMKRILGISTPRMPLTGPPWLSEEQIERIRQWIDGGAKNGSLIVEKPAGAPAEKIVKNNEFVTYSEVAPIFKLRCVKCHNTKGLMGPPPEKLILAGYADILDTGERARVVPGNPAASELMRRIRGQARPQMPFDGPPFLSETEIALIEKWIAQGARDAEGNPAPVPVGARVRLHGRLTAKWALDGLPLTVTGRTRIKKAPGVGDYVQVRGVIGDSKGSVAVERIRPR